MRAILDLDDVILDFHTAYLSYGKTHLGIEMDIRNHKTFDYYQQYGFSDEAFLEQVSTPEFISIAKPFDFAKKSIDQLSSSGYEIIIVTARGYMDKPVEFVENLFIDHDLFCNEIIVPKNGQTKSSCYKKFGKINLLIDDGAHNIADAIESEIVDHIYLINRPWNESFAISKTNVIRANSILDAVTYHLNN